MVLANMYLNPEVVEKENMSKRCRVVDNEHVFDLGIEMPQVELDQGFGADDAMELQADLANPTSSSKVSSLRNGSVLPNPPPPPLQNLLRSLV